MLSVVVRYCLIASHRIASHRIASHRLHVAELGRALKVLQGLLEILVHSRASLVLALQAARAAAGPEG